MTFRCDSRRQGLLDTEGEAAADEEEEEEEAEERGVAVEAEEEEEERKGTGVGGGGGRREPRVRRPGHNSVRRLLFRRPVFGPRCRPKKTERRRSVAGRRDTERRDERDQFARVLYVP